MRAVMAVSPGVLGLGELEVPKPGPFEALVRMDACAICNSTDHKLLTGEFVPGSFPVVLGHEVLGTVVDLGSSVKHFATGDRVFRQRLRDEHVPGAGRSCWGGFAEYGLVVDEWARQDLPYGPDALAHDQQKLILDVEPALATGMVTLMETLDCAAACGAGPGKSVAVVGSGPVGQALALFGRLLGAAPVVAFGRSPAAADRFAAVARVDGYVTGSVFPPEVERIIAGGGFDVVIEAVGSTAALETCIRLAGARGQVRVYGVAPVSAAFPAELMSRPQVNTVGAREGRAQARLAGWVESGDVDLQDWVTHRLPLAGYQTAFDLVAAREAFKAVLIP